MEQDTKGAIQALESSGRRVKVHDTVMNVKMPHSIRELVNHIAEGQGVSDSAIVRAALAEYLRKRGYSQ